MRNGERTTVTSVDRALQLLLHLRNGPLTVKAASEQLAVAPSTAYRLLSTLTARGFAEQAGDRRYGPGPELVLRAADQLSLDDLRRRAHPALRQLHADVDDTVQLMVLSGASIQFIDGIESSAVLRVAPRVGAFMPAYCSAGGKAILAALAWSEVERCYPAGLTPWESAKLRSMEELADELARTRSARYGMNHDETEAGVTGVGVSITGPAGGPVAAFTVAIPSARFHCRNLSHYVRSLTVAAQTASEALVDL